MHNQLSNSYQWNMLNQNNRVNLAVQTLIRNGEAVTLDRMPTAASIIRNRMKSPILNKMVDAIADGNLILVFNPGNDQVPAFLPFVTMQQDRHYMAVIFLNSCGAKLGDADEIFIDERKLKVSMESAFLTLRMLDYVNEGKLQSANIVKPSSKMYTYMITECINRKHSIKMDQSIFNAIAYMVSRFFIKIVIGSTSVDDVVDTYCMANCVNPNPGLIHQYLADVEDKDYENISTLITKMVSIPQLQSRIGKMTVSNFTESYINMYDAAALLAMETYPYLVFNILSVIDTTYANNYFHLKNIVGDDGKKLYATLISTLC